MSESSTYPYIGVPITIISKAEIRYEGILYAINPTEHTVSLTQVRSFGTEDRKPNPQFIPPSDELYEFIIFKGSEIKDLQVLNTHSPPQSVVSSASLPVQSSSEAKESLQAISSTPKPDSAPNQPHEAPKESSDKKYDKKLSFFDSLTGGEEAKFDRKAIEIRDSETFGESNVRSAQNALKMYLNRGRRGRNRGRYRGRGT